MDYIVGFKVALVVALYHGGDFRFTPSENPWSRLCGSDSGGDLGTLTESYSDSEEPLPAAEEHSPNFQLRQFANLSRISWKFKNLRIYTIRFLKRHAHFKHSIQTVHLPLRD